MISGISRERILQLAREFGFDEAGITKPELLEEGEKAIEAWIQQDRHGSMQYLKDFAQRKARFYEAFPDAKSVIVLGVNYFTQTRHSDLPAAGKEKIFGKIARYAWGQDYHLVIRRKHEELIAAIQKEAGPKFHAKSCVDTQPLPERYAAARAGLGFSGKHTGILSAKYGPWLFLSEIVTNLELEESAPAEGDCGTCVHCQKVCPTGALDKDYTMDARKCIAYLTIEHKGMIPPEYRTQVKDWIFGCDECFEVCPFTSKSRESGWPELGPASGTGPWMEITELFEIQSNKEYERKFQGTALLRTTRKQMLRNACLVLGNSGKPEAVPYLKKALEDAAPLVRAHAAWGLGQLGGPEARRALIQCQSAEQDPEVLQEIQNALTIYPI